MITFGRYLVEGLIKLPEKMLKDGQSKIASDICSYVSTELGATSRIHDSDAEDVKKMIAHVKELAAQYNAPIRHLKKKTRSKYKIDLDIADLPTSYKKNTQIEKEALKLELDIDWDHYQGRLKSLKADASYSDSKGGKIVMGIGSITTMHWETVLKYPAFVDLFDNRLERIMLNFEHELTHYVQYKVLGDAMNDRFADKREIDGGRSDAYYNKDLEFDPLIKSAIGTYRRYEKDNLEAKLAGGRREWVEFFIGTKSVPRELAYKLKQGLISGEKYGGFVVPSEFFLSLKKHQPDKWKKAIKLFTQELDKRYPNESK